MTDVDDGDATAGDASTKVPNVDPVIPRVAHRMGPITDEAYLEAKAKCAQWSCAEGIDALMEKHQLDAIIALTYGPAHALDLIHDDQSLGGSKWPCRLASEARV